jgi:hypothetical protein
MKRFFGLIALLGTAASTFLVDLAHAAGGGGAAMLVVVADTRRVEWSGTKYFLDLYNTDPMMFGIVCVILTAFFGCGLGLLTDQVMKRTGIDLHSRKIIEH